MENSLQLHKEIKPRKYEKALAGSLLFYALFVFFVNDQYKKKCLYSHT